MNTLEVNEALRCLPHFVGTFPRNKIPLDASRPCSYVINLDEASNPGSHWVALYVDEYNNANYFDSYGKPPPDDCTDLIKILSCFSPKPILFSHKKLQSIESTVCGHYCALFVILTGEGVSMGEFQSLFSDDYAFNDLVVKKLIRDYIRQIVNHRPSL